MARTRKSINGKGEWREVAGPFGLEIRVSPLGDLEVRGRIRSPAELDAMMDKLRTAVQVEYEFQRARDREAAEGVYRDSDAEQIALFEKAAADWPRIPVLGEASRASGPAVSPLGAGDALLGQSARRGRGGTGSSGVRDEERLSA